MSPQYIHQNLRPQKRPRSVIPGPKGSFANCLINFQDILPAYRYFSLEISEEIHSLFSRKNASTSPSFPFIPHLNPASLQAKVNVSFSEDPCMRLQMAPATNVSPAPKVISNFLRWEGIAVGFHIFRPDSICTFYSPGTYNCGTFLTFRM